MSMAETHIIRGTANVFADLGLPDAAGRQTKTRLALALNRIIKDQEITVTVHLTPNMLPNYGDVA